MNVSVETLIGLVRSAYKEGRASMVAATDPLATISQRDAITRDAAAEESWQKSEAHGFLEELVHDQAMKPGMEDAFAEELDQR